MDSKYPIEIIGYITETHGSNSFTIKITNDNVEDEKGIHPEVSKEKEIIIDRYHYPDDYYQRFEKVETGARKENINRCISICKELKKGDRVECRVFIVTGSVDNNNTTYSINENPNDIETYTKFRLLLYPYEDFFKRLEVDTPETLKFRKQNYYTDINQKKCEKITGSKWKYEKKWWINKNPKIIFPILGWLWIKTKVSNLWGKFTEQNKVERNVRITLIIITIISITVSIILAILYFKKTLI